MKPRLTDSPTHRLKLGIFLSVFLSFFYFTSASANSGDLDPSFDDDGIFTNDFDSGNEEDSPHAIAIQADGKIVTAGFIGPDPGDFLIVRHNTDGSLDDSFSSDGVVTTDFSGGSDSANGVAIQDDGKIIVAGTSSFLADFSEIALARYNMNGSLDAGFGTGGLVMTPIAGKDAGAQGLAIQGDGKIIVVGSAGDDFLAARYQTNGDPDSSFGTGGIDIIDIAGDLDIGTAVALQEDDKIVAAVRAFPIDGFVLVRYDTSGVPDTGFGTAGIVMTSFPGANDGGASDVRIQDDGKIVVGGFTVNGGANFALARYNTDGSLDTGFDTDGLVTNDFGAAGGNIDAIALQADGKIVAAGGVATDEASDDFGVARFNASGSLDTSFGGGDGLVNIDFQEGIGTDDPSDIALQSDGKILVAGTFFDIATGEPNYALVRLVGDTADLNVEKSLESDETTEDVVVGSTFNYIIRVTNEGPESAQGVVVTDTLPTETDFNSVTTSQGTCSGTTTVTCELGTILNGEIVTITINITFNSGGEVNNTATVTAETTDPDDSDNSSTFGATVVGGDGGGCQLTSTSSATSIFANVLFVLSALVLLILKRRCSQT